jgi:hypothetical protein
LLLRIGLVGTRRCHSDVERCNRTDHEQQSEQIPDPTHLSTP